MTVHWHSIPVQNYPHPPIKITRALIPCALVLLLNISSFCQVDGLWIVKKVMVGNEDNTPVARWFRLNNESQTSGNGWQQHSYGSYKWDKQKSTVSFVTDNEPADEFGAFTVTWKNNTMTWERMEEGTKVVVELEQGSALPLSTADRIKGLWGPEHDPNSQHYVFIRWDRVYKKQIRSGESATGYWFINAHAPRLKFISHNPGVADEEWRVSFDDSKLVLTGLSENIKDVTMVYKRISDFPK